MIKDFLNSQKIHILKFSYIQSTMRAEKYYNSQLNIIYYILLDTHFV